MAVDGNGTCFRQSEETQLVTNSNWGWRMRNKLGLLGHHAQMYSEDYVGIQILIYRKCALLSARTFTSMIVGSKFHGVYWDEGWHVSRSKTRDLSPISQPSQKQKQNAPFGHGFDLSPGLGCSTDFCEEVSNDGKIPISPSSKWVIPDLLSAAMHPTSWGRLWEHRRSCDSGGGEHVPIPPAGEDGGCLTTKPAGFTHNWNGVNLWGTPTSIMAPTFWLVWLD